MMQHMMLMCFILLFLNTGLCQDIIKVDFSEPMDSTNLFNCENYIITSQEPYAICRGAPGITCIFKPNELGYDSLVYVYVLTENHIDGEYMVEILNVSDLSGNIINVKLNYALYGGSVSKNLQDGNGK